MRLLISSYSGVYVLEPFKSNKTHYIHRNSGMYYGITWSEDNLYLVARNNKGDQNMNKNEHIVILDNNFKKKGIIEFKENPGTGFHSIQYDPQYNNLWVTAPGLNKLILINLDNNNHKNIFPNKTKNKRNNHFNSLTLLENKILVNSHNGFSSIGRSQIYVYSRDKKPKLLEIINTNVQPGSHNCFYIGDELCTCDSFASQVSTIDGKKLLPNRLNGYTRGIVLTDKYLVVGESQRAERHDRLTADGRIHIYKLDNMDKMKEIYLKNIGQIAEVRSLDDVDYHHDIPLFKC